MPGLADIVRRDGPAYLARHWRTILPSHRRALRDLAACRTPALGGHVRACDRCGYEHYAYHSCRNRSCAQCHGTATARWLRTRQDELLPVPYFHVVFTLPAELRELVRSHQRVLLSALMATAAESLQALAADPHYLGGTVGMLAVLHTWTRALIYHPHVHCLVPGGALAPDRSRWRPARGHFLVPVRALAVRFRARFLARITTLVPNATIPPLVWHRPWVVYCKPAVHGRDRVLRYLARYVHRVAITDARVLRVADGHVTFRYTDRAHAWRTMTLPSDEFLRRFLQHVLPRGFHKVRYYGWWRPAATALRTALQQQLAAASRLATRAARLAPAQAAVTPVRYRCPRCARGELQLVGILTPWTFLRRARPPCPSRPRQRSRAMHVRRPFSSSGSSACPLIPRRGLAHADVCRSAERIAAPVVIDHEPTSGPS